MAARNPGDEECAKGGALLAPRISHGHFFLAIFFHVMHDRLSEWGTTRSLFRWRDDFISHFIPVKIASPLTPLQWCKKLYLLGLARVHHWFRGQGGFISDFILTKIVIVHGGWSRVIYCLFVFAIVKPIPRRVDVACYNETYQRKLEMFTKRVSLSLVLICTMHCWDHVINTERWLEWSLWLDVHAPCYELQIQTTIEPNHFTSTVDLIK